MEYEIYIYFVRVMMVFIIISMVSTLFFDVKSGTNIENSLSLFYNAVIKPSLKAHYWIW